jgi:hypothetical protein
MIKTSLHQFVDRILEDRAITAADVDVLRREVLPDGLASREEADVLIALDRAVPGADPAYATFLVASVVEFVVWTARPTGYVEEDACRWLATSLSCGGGPTENALRVAFEVVKEAQRVDETLLAFVMRASQRRPVYGLSPRNVAVIAA